MGDFYFPYEKVRPVQDEFMAEVAHAVENHGHLVVHAPTGIGKTAAVLAPAIKYAKEHEKTIFFLTSRHTQHRIIIDTLKLIRQKFGIKLCVADIIGKKWMCAQKGVEKLYSSEFFDYCKNMREDDMCTYFKNLKLGGKLSPAAARLVQQAKQPVHCEEFVSQCRVEKLCPYELAMIIARTADVVVADYSYVFDPVIKHVFFSKLDKQLENSIVIVDEAHNLPNRLRESMSDSLSQIMLDNSVRELKKHKRFELMGKLETLRDGFARLGYGLSNERLATKAEFSQIVEAIESASLLHDRLEGFATFVREQNQRSWCGGVARFLDNWDGPDEGFVRFLRKSEKGLVLFYKALDPALLSRGVIEATHSTIVMSGTLTPTSMFKDILGFPENTVLQEYESPFPRENRLAMIVPVTSTRYKSRSPEEFKRMAMVCGAIADEVPGNVAFFFPSYKVRDEVASRLKEFTAKQLLFEERGMNKQDKHRLLQQFVGLRLKGACLLGIVRGSFGEGIDFPGDWLHGVVVVGLPLARPDIETQAIIDYFNKLNGKGIDYGYVFPAINLALQSAGRCIRSEKDTGVVVLLDERYAYPRYMACLPKDWHFGVTKNFPQLIQDFFSV